MALSTASSLAMPFALGTAIDQALQEGVRRDLFFLGGFILFAGASRAIFGYFQNYLAEAVSQKTAYDIRNDFFRKLQSLSFGFHDKQQTGNLMSKATADVEAVQRFVSLAMIRGMSMVATLVFVLIIMVNANWRLALVVFIFIPPMMWRAMSMSFKLRKTWTAVQAETGAMTTTLQESIAGIKVVKVFGAREHAERQFGVRAGILRDLTYSVTRQFAFHGSLMTFLFIAATGAILWYGGREVGAGRLTEGQLAAFILYMNMLAMPVRMIGFMVNNFTRAQSAGARLFEVLDAESPVTERPNARELRKVEGHVIFDNVSMRYDPTGAPTVSDISFEAEPGQLVAILGAPGSGKSTLVHLIPRFYDVTDGRIIIDGHDVRDLTLPSLRRNVGIVMQDVFIFGASMKENIAYGAENAGEDDIVRAAKIAQLHDFKVEQLPRGYDTWVGERGVRLSGGQRQRLAIARTILLDPRILVLDDSTSSVDMGTEFRIQQALGEVIKGRTTFVIAHRLSTVRRADLILVLDEGRIVERGTHQELLAAGGFYRNIYDLQLRPQEDEDGVSTAAGPTAVAEQPTPAGD